MLGEKRSKGGGKDGGQEEEENRKLQRRERGAKMKMTTRKMAWRMRDGEMVRTTETTARKANATVRKTAKEEVLKPTDLA